ncbi:MAG: hypothetical protein P8046_12035 [Anaerolineales bacterium]
MKAKRELLIDQLRHACRYTQAKWGVYLFRGGEKWEVDFSYGLNKDRLAVFQDIIQDPKVIRWLDEKSQIGRDGYRTLPPNTGLAWNECMRSRLLIRYGFWPLVLHRYLREINLFSSH